MIMVYYLQARSGGHVSPGAGTNLTMRWKMKYSHAECWFDYKTVIVSGASSGIGKGIVNRLIREFGCNVIGIARNEQKILELKASLGDHAEKFTYRLFDVSVRENWKDFAKYLEENEIRPTLLINCAGILPRFDRFEHYTIEYIEHAMNINFYSCVYSMHYMMPILLKSENPGIVNIASSAALCTLAGTSVYSASKSALKSLTEAVREEMRGRCYIGIVCPGFTKTNIFTNQGYSTDKGYHDVEKVDWQDRALEMVSTNCDRMVNDIVDGIWKRKRTNMVYGFDAHLMNIGSKAIGVGVSFLSSKVLKASRVKLFADVFSDD